MKLFIIFILILISSCSKEDLPAPQDSVTSYALNYDDKWNLIDEKVSFHWHNLEPEILQQFINKPNDTLCTLAGNLVLTYKIIPDNCK